VVNFFDAESAADHVWSRRHAKFARSDAAAKNYFAAARGQFSEDIR
jgi:hypothetical protein